MKRLSYILAVAMAAILSPFANAADAQRPEKKMEPSRVMQVLLDDNAKDFFETAASANLFEIESSQLALQRATDPALKAFAKRMVQDHEKAGRELKALARKKDVTLSTQLLRRHKAMLDDLRDEKQGPEFDDEYRRKMIASHKEAVSLFDEVATDAKDPDIKAFAAKTLPTLQAHGGSAQELREPD